MKKEAIGTNAGIVWRLLDVKKAGLTLEEIASQTELDTLNVAAAIGWLSREEKLWTSENKNGETLYSLFHDYYY